MCNTYTQCITQNNSVMVQLSYFSTYTHGNQLAIGQNMHTDIAYTAHCISILRGKLYDLIWSSQFLHIYIFTTHKVSKRSIYIYYKKYPILINGQVLYSINLSIGQNCFSSKHSVWSWHLV